eukprot:scaffold6625_cov139-Skeletonema_marinoi.AAC.4
MPGVEVVDSGAFSFCKALTDVDVECDKLQNTHSGAAAATLGVWHSVKQPCWKDLRWKSIPWVLLSPGTITIPLKDGLIDRDDR